MPFKNSPTLQSIIFSLLKLLCDYCDSINTARFSPRRFWWIPLWRVIFSQNYNSSFECALLNRLYLLPVEILILSWRERFFPNWEHCHTENVERKLESKHSFMCIFFFQASGISKLNTSIKDNVPAHWRYHVARIFHAYWDQVRKMII